MARWAFCIPISKTKRKSKKVRLVRENKVVYERGWENLSMLILVINGTWISSIFFRVGDFDTDLRWLLRPCLVFRRKLAFGEVKKK
jgi:hypothetical protein